MGAFETGKNKNKKIEDLKKNSYQCVRKITVTERIIG